MSIPFKFNSLGISGKFRKPLRLTATQNSSSVKITKTGSPNVSGLKYKLSSSDPWSTYTIDTVIELDKDEYVEFFNSNNTLNLDESNYANFVMNGKINASGNIQSLINFEKNCSAHCFEYLFNGCTALIDISQLKFFAGIIRENSYRGMFTNCSGLVNGPIEISAREVGVQGCQSMFYNCSSLINAPILKQTVLGNYCYRYMFQGCSSLTSAPSLPATTLAIACYNSMFQGCSSLTSAPELPATTLAYSCYKSMFTSCSSLTSVPELPATTLADYCYQYMFAQCTNLINAPELPATTLATACYSYMFSVCRSLTTTPNLVAITLAPYCYEGMFNLCTSLVTASELPATTLATSCYNAMFRACTSLRSAPNLPALTLANNCYYSMFDGCTGLIVGPTMNATTLATNSCVTMFSGCSLLQSITVKFSDWGDSSATNNWLLNVASTGTFTKPGGLAETRGPSNIPTGWSIANSYKRNLAYLESTGTQYIDTGVKPNFPNNDEIYISFYGAEYSGSSPAIFGSRQSDLRNGVYALGGNVTVLDADGYTSHAFDLVGNRWVKMDNLKVTSNGRNYEYTLTRHPNCTYSIYLFALNNGGNTYGIYNGMKIYEWKYYQNGELKQWLIPVMNNDDIPCMYDLVNGTFKYNAGTGQFNYGEL